MISVLLINLDRSVDRLNFQKQQIEKLKLLMKRFVAVRGDDIKNEVYENLANGWERKLFPNEVACFLSHKGAWQYVAESNKPWLIMEDDALLANSVPNILRAIINKNENNTDYVVLETRYRHKWLDKKSIDLVDGYQMRRLYQDRNGSAAYILFPSGARKLLLKAQRSKPALADAFLSCSYELNAWQVYPAAAIQLDQCNNYGLNFTNPFDSTITLNTSRPKLDNFKDYCRFKLRRVIAQLRMGIRQLSVYKHAERIKVPIRNDDFDVNLENYFQF